MCDTVTGGNEKNIYIITQSGGWTDVESVIVGATTDYTKAEQMVAEANLGIRVLVDGKFGAIIGTDQ